MDVIAVYDTNEKIESRATSDLLAQLLMEYLPESEAWISQPDEDDLRVENWTPRWSDISEALAQIEGFLRSEGAQAMVVDGFHTEELLDELRFFCDELRAAQQHTPRFHLTVY